MSFSKGVEELSDFQEGKMYPLIEANPQVQREVVEKKDIAIGDIVSGMREDNVIEKWRVMSLAEDKLKMQMEYLGSISVAENKSDS